MSLTNTIPTEEELNAIPKENWVAWLRAEYNHDCGEPDHLSVTTNKEEMDEEHRDNDYMIYFKTFCSRLNQTYCEVTPKQYEKIKSGFYNDQLDNNKFDIKKMLDFMEYTPRYEGEDNLYENKEGDVIFINYTSEIDFRPDINWRDLTSDRLH